MRRAPLLLALLLSGCAALPLPLPTLPAPGTGTWVLIRNQTPDVLAVGFAHPDGERVSIVVLGLAPGGRVWGQPPVECIREGAVRLAVQSSRSGGWLLLPPNPIVDPGGRGNDLTIHPAGASVDATP